MLEIVPKTPHMLGKFSTTKLYFYSLTFNNDTKYLGVPKIRTWTKKMYDSTLFLENIYAIDPGSALPNNPI